MRISVQIANGVNYIPVPIDCKVNGVLGVANADPGADSSITLSQGGNTISVCTLSGESAGTVVAGVKDATYGDTTLEGKSALVATCVSTNSVAMTVTLDMDEYLVG